MDESTTQTNSEFSDQPSSRPEGRSWGGKLLLLLILVGIGAGAWYARPMLARQFSGEKRDRFSHLITEVASTGPFLVTVNIQGNLDSQGNAILSSQVEGSTTIISIVPEGSWVEEGDVVCTLDAAPLEDMAKQQEITVTNADAAQSQAREALEVAKTQNESDIAAADLALQLAVLDLEKYTSPKGEYSKLENELDGNVKIAEQEAIQSEDTYEFTKRNVKKGYKNQNELEAARIQVEKSNLALSKAEEELHVLQNFEKQRTEAELEANAKEFGRELERVKLRGNAAIIQAEQAYLAAKKSAELEHDKLAKLRQQIENCKLIAPQSGEVVYANLPSQSRRGGSDGPAIEEGAEVRERQPIINLPDPTQMKVDSRVHESLIGYMRAGLPCKVQTDAYPDENYRAKIASVSSVPMTGRFPNYDLREYEVEIHLTDAFEKVKKLKPGMTAQIEVLVNSRDNVLQVPVQSVVGIGGKYFSFVLKPDGPQRRELQIGESNETDIEIKDGVADGEQVVMNPRTHFAEEISELATLLGAERNERMREEMPIDSPPLPPGVGGGPGGGGGPQAGGGPRAGGGQKGGGGPGGDGGPQAGGDGPRGGGGPQAGGGDRPRQGGGGDRPGRNAG